MYILRTLFTGNYPPLNGADCMPIETLWSRAKTYNKAACTPRCTFQQLWEHTGAGMFTDNVASPETHYYYFCGHFVEDAQGVCSEADKYIRHV